MQKEIVNVCIFRSNDNVKNSDLVSDLDYEGAFEFNEDNLIFVGYDSDGKSYILDDWGRIVCESEYETYKNSNFLAKAEDIDGALEILNDFICSKFIVEECKDPNSPDLGYVVGIED